MLRTPFSMLLALALVFTLACNKQEAEENDAQETTTEETATMTDQEVEIAIEDLPVEVLASFKEAYPGAETVGASKEMEDETMIYEIAFKLNDAMMEAEYSADGAFIAEEKEIALDALPSVIADAAKKAHPEMKLDEAEMITLPDGSIQYEVVLEDAEDNEAELLFDSKGNILKTEMSADDEGEHDDKDKDDD